MSSVVFTRRSREKADLHARSIRVTTNDSTAHLHGHLPSLAALQTALHAAETAPGINAGDGHARSRNRFAHQRSPQRMELAEGESDGKFVENRGGNRTQTNRSFAGEQSARQARFVCHRLPPLALTPMVRNAMKKGLP